MQGVLNLTLAGLHGTQIVWASDNPIINQVTGHVAAPVPGLVNIDVTLTATISKNNENKTKVFPNLTVQSAYNSAGFHKQTGLNQDLEPSKTPAQLTNDRQQFKQEVFNKRVSSSERWWDIGTHVLGYNRMVNVPIFHKYRNSIPSRITVALPEAFLSKIPQILKDKLNEYPKIRKMELFFSIQKVDVHDGTGETEYQG